MQIDNLQDKIHDLNDKIYENETEIEDEKY
jgi:hypothetical protein